MVYEVMSKTDFTLTNWTIEPSVLFSTNSTAMPFTVPALDRTNALFIWARDWTGVTENGNTVPDWWFWEYFRMLDLSDTNLDSQGNTLLNDYTNDFDPNVIQFLLSFTNDYVNSSIAYGTIMVSGGAPAYMAVLINDTNQADTVWQPYNPIIVAGLNACDGKYNILVGLRGLPDDTEQTWLGAQLTLDTVPPVITITNPISSTVGQPMIQLQGYANETLGSLTFAVSNAAGIWTNQTGYTTGQFCDTNLFEFTTNWFQCYDIALTNGLNTITLHAADLAGNTTTTNVSFTLDYSSGSNPPVSYLSTPHQTVEIKFDLGRLCKFAEIGTYNITAEKRGIWSVEKHKQFKVTSNQVNNPAQRGLGRPALSPVSHLFAKTELFLPLFLLLLPFYILPYHLLIQPHRANTVALRPEMIPPVAPLPQIPKCTEHSDRRLALQPPLIIRDRQLRRYLHDQTHMIRLHIQLQHLTVHLPRLFPHT